ncbi:MBOAT family O-acyltransferase [Anaerovibrio sp.]|uniref:MBOAT family O-acyltransferase n=1 Tax=Anaerovibrio sp. TaxID=1872532 RepID=UPI00344FC8A6
MLFNSYPFIFLYLPIVFATFFLTAKYISHRAATFTLVLASFVFYGYWDVKYIPLLFGSICFNYFIGRQLNKHTKSKFWLVVGLGINILLLGYFKYTDFFLTTINDINGVQIFDLPHIVLPLGISFFTFTQSAYLVDAYRKEAAPHNFLTYCEFVTIFPHLIAGPIINHKEMIPQFINEKTFHIDYKNIALGLTIFTFGLFKKVVIADKLAVWANEAFSHVSSLTCTEAWVGALGYTLQLYFDFSGYSEMAIGLALLFNLKMPVNFNSPYQARSIIDFWRRWHMTLGLWVKNYLYIPMGGNRHGEFSKMRNLFVSMLIIGLWHGAGWTFIIWGGIHGLLLMINHQWRRLNINLPKAINWGVTFLCVMICWVFFRAECFNDAINVLNSMVDFQTIDRTGLKRLVTLCVAVGLLTIIPNPIQLIEKAKFPTIRWEVATILLLVLSILYIKADSPFLYFQF